MKTYKEFMEESAVLTESMDTILTMLATAGISLPLTQFVLMFLELAIFSEPYERRFTRGMAIEWGKTKQKYIDLLHKLQDLPEWKKLESNQEFRDYIKSVVKHKSYKRGKRQEAEEKIREILGDVDAEKIIRMLNRVKDGFEPNELEKAREKSTRNFKGIE